MRIVIVFCLLLCFVSSTSAGQRDRASFQIIAEPLGAVASALRDFSGVSIDVSPELRDTLIDFIFPKGLSRFEALAHFEKIVAPANLLIRPIGEGVGRRTGKSALNDPEVLSDEIVQGGINQTFTSFRLRYRIATDVASVMTQIFSKMHFPSGYSRPQIVGVDPLSNVIYISADNTEASLTAQGVVSEIDKPLDSTGGTSLVVLNHTDSMQMQSVLQRFAAGADKRAGSVELVPGNALLITGPLPMRNDLKTLAEALDIESPKVQIQVRVLVVPATQSEVVQPAVSTAEMNVESGQEAALEVPKVASGLRTCSASNENSRYFLRMQPSVFGDEIRIRVRLVSKHQRDADEVGGADVMVTTVLAQHDEETVAMQFLGATAVDAYGTCSSYGPEQMTVVLRARVAQGGHRSEGGRNDRHSHLLRKIPVYGYNGDSTIRPKPAISADSDPGGFAVRRTLQQTGIVSTNISDAVRDESLNLMMSDSLAERSSDESGPLNLGVVWIGFRRWLCSTLISVDKCDRGL